MSNSWKCTICETVNNDGSPRCVVCEAPRVGASDSVVPGQGGRSADDPANDVPQTVTMFSSPVAPSPMSAPPAEPAAAAVTTEESSASRRGIVIGVVALAALVLVGALAFKLGSSSTTTATSPSSTTEAPKPKVSNPADESKPAAGGSTSVVVAPATSPAVVTVVTVPPTAAPVTVAPPPITSPPTPPTVAVPGVGTITGTCDEGTTCGTFVREAPQQSATPLSKTALQDGQQVTIACSTTGDLRRSGTTESAIWYRLTTGGYVAAVFVFTHALVSAC